LKLLFVKYPPHKERVETSHTQMYQEAKASIEFNNTRILGGSAKKSFIHFDENNMQY
jgi:hypothetical protein